MSNTSPGRRPLPPDLARPREGAEPYNDLWMEWVREIESYFGYKVCGSRGKRNPWPCPQKPVHDRTRCYHHGGKTPKAGPDHPRWKHGQASVFRQLLPQRMQEVYDNAIHDPERLSLASDLALAVVAQQQALQALGDSGDPYQAIRQANEHIGELTIAIAEGADPTRVGACVDRLATALRQANNAADALDRVLELSEKKRKLADTERKRMESLQRHISAEEVRARDQMLVAIVVQAAQQMLPKDLSGPYLRQVMEGIMALSGGSLPALPSATPPPGKYPLGVDELENKIGIIR